MPVAEQKKHPVPVVPLVLEQLMAASLNGGEDVEALLCNEMLLERHLHTEPIPARGNTPEEQQAFYDAVRRCAYGTLRLLRQRVESPARVLVRDLSRNDIEVRTPAANPGKIFLQSGYPEWHSLQDIGRLLAVAETYFDIPEDRMVLRRYFQNISLG